MCLFSQHIYLLMIGLFISVQTHGYLCYILGYNTIVLYFAAQMFPALAIGSSYLWLLCPQDIVLCMCVYVCVQHFLTFQHYKMLQAYLAYSFLYSQEQPFLQRDMVNFIGEWYQKPRFGQQVLLLLLGYCCFPIRLFQLTEQGNICMYLHIHIS